jgi:hypothetical protein
MRFTRAVLRIFPLSISIALAIAACTDDETTPATLDAGSPSLDATAGDSARADAGAASESSVDSSPSDSNASDSLPADAGTDATGDADAAVDADAACTMPALYFKNATDTINAQSDGGLDFGTATTWEMWLHGDTQPDGGVSSGTLFNKWTNFQEDKYVGTNSVGAVFVYLHVPPSAAVSLTSTSSVASGRWSHVAMVHDATSTRIYIDGAKAGESVGSTTVANSTGPIQIGHVSRDYQSPPVQGFYSEIRISNVARYTADFTPTLHLGADGNTQAFWKLDEGAGTTAADSSGLAHSGTIAGATWAQAPCR